MNKVLDIVFIDLTYRGDFVEQLSKCCDGDNSKLNHSFPYIKIINNKCEFDLIKPPFKLINGDFSIVCDNWKERLEKYCDLVVILIEKVAMNDGLIHNVIEKMNRCDPNQIIIMEDSRDEKYFIRRHKKINLDYQFYLYSFNFNFIDYHSAYILDVLALHSVSSFSSIESIESIDSVSDNQSIKKINEINKVNEINNKSVPLNEYYEEIKNPISANVNTNKINKIKKLIEIVDSFTLKDLFNKDNRKKIKLAMDMLLLNEPSDTSIMGSNDKINKFLIEVENLTFKDIMDPANRSDFELLINCLKKLN